MSRLQGSPTLCQAVVAQRAGSPLELCYLMLKDQNVASEAETYLLTANVQAVMAACH